MEGQWVGPAEIISELCHTDTQDPFPVWRNGTFSPCFNQVVFGSLPYAAVAVVSACYLSTPRCTYLQAHQSYGWGFRAASALLLWLLFIGDVVAVALLQDPNIYLDVLADGCAIIAWLVHFGAMVVLQRSAYRCTRGPPVLVVLVVLLIPNLVITVTAYVQNSNYLDLLQVLRVLRLAMAVARAALLLVYLLAFVVPCIRGVRDPMSINASDMSPLLPQRISVGEMVAEDGSGCLSRLLYLWLNPLLQQGERGELERPSDVYQLPKRLRTAAVHRRFRRCWEDCQKGAALRRHPETLQPSEGSGLQNGSWTEPQDGAAREEVIEDVSLLRVLHRAFGLRYYSLGVLKLAASMLAFAGPLLLSGLIGFMESEAAPVRQGAWCAAGLFASTFVSALLRNVFVFEVSKVSLEARAAVVSAIYGKALRVSGSALARFTLGEVVNFMSTDTDRLVNFFNSFHEAWSLPFQFALALYLLYLQVGVAFLGGLGVAILLVPLNKVLASRILENNKHMLTHKDNRVKLMTEVLFGIRVLKFYNWEQHFAQKIGECRKRELSHLKAIKYLDAVCVYTWSALPVVISILTFVTYVLLGNQLTAAKVFTTLALVGMLILPLNSFPWVLNGTLEAKVSLDRIQRFLRLHNQDLGAYYNKDAPEDPLSSLELLQASFSWQAPDPGGTHSPPEEQTNSGSPTGSLLLSSLNLSVQKGRLVAVVGKVGCGKSSLLAAISGELQRLGGSVYVAGRTEGFGLAAQEPWIQHATVRDNVLFGRDFDSTFYQTVIEACALSDDLNMLPSGDRTEVGENGVTLSGGQKSRLALARAVYMDKEIYLLDDPLAAVDADVAHHLMEKCILGILGTKTRILCTHRIEFLDRADVVVLMDNGTIVKIGSPSEVLPLVEAEPKDRKNDSNKKEKDVIHQKEEQESSNELPLEEGPEDSGEEQKQVGGLAWSVFTAYWRAVGGALAASVLFSLLLMQASKNVSEWWLSHWISHLKSNSSGAAVDVDLPPPHQSPLLLLFSPGGLTSPLSLRETSSLGNMSSDVKFYMTVYGSLATANTLFTAARAFLFAYGAICAAAVIHDRLLGRVLKATVTFYDTTPLGRVLNRFSSDMYSADDSLPFVLNILLANVFGLLGMLVVMTYGLPWLLLPLLPLGALYYRTQRFYRHSSRELKRLCSLTLSPVYSHFSETLAGLSTVRASGSAARFEEENEQRLEQNQRCLFASNAAMQWLDIRLQMIGVALVTGIGIIAVVQHQFKSIDPGLVGLSLSYALSITNLLSGLIFSFAQTEMQMVSVERTEEYSTCVPVEPQDGRRQVPPEWPQHGRVEFSGAALAYRPGLPNALDGVSVEVLPGERVGIVGRTGSGKSTLFLALFRMVELNQGCVLLDGVDISQVALSQLRSKMAVIPQDPFLFSGSVRDNLDPCGRHSDPRLLDALEQCHLEQVVRRIGGLEAEVGEKGKSLSVGQRQLLCLARALLTEANVLCIDEATASVDQKTDMLLQKTIRDMFKDRTVLTIAHRLNTIMDSDRVIVMHAGKVVEFDTPAALSQRDDSFFHRLLGGRGA
ncbi:ATP-binding cassette sub-family C member 10-like [Clupea harengus]|uniref:ATP-binding cassette sub-family C member 10 n=1 Tax=Clupea harengus TaxID=7950 RepID=A0A6P8F1T7_CLUHA|nr:ATP-binding cassette sub-family C member 10-like [Clupea harengus]XP_042559397.1 ATP-binding cassette sub-family C member 10-like [Clupea harengus]